MSRDGCFSYRRALPGDKTYIKFFFSQSNRGIAHYGWAIPWRKVWFVKDVLTRAEIAVVVDRFYTKAMQDPIIGYLFEGLDLPKHLPTIYDFWENILFRTGAYKGGMMYKHLMLNAQKPLRLLHFQRWLELFTQTIDEHFAGENANTMKQFAYSVANTIYARISQQNAIPLGVEDAPKW